MKEEDKLAYAEVSGRVSRAETLIENMLRNDEVYHAHKENMANAGIAVMLALLGAVVGMHEWPDALWIPNLTIYIPKRWTAFLGFSTLWLLIHVFVRWQLRNRRFAAIRQAAALHALIQWILRSPLPSDITLPDASTNPSLARTPSQASALAFLDWFFPYPQPTLRSDVRNDDYPPWFADEIRKQESSGTGALIGEWILTLGSYFVLLVAAIRTFCMP